MKDLDAVAGEFDGVARLALAAVERGGHLLRRDPQAGAVEVEAVEFLRVVAQRAVAAGGNVGDDGADRRVDVGRCFALGVEKRAKFLRKIGGARIETNGHHVALCIVR